MIIHDTVNFLLQQQLLTTLPIPFALSSDNQELWKILKLRFDIPKKRRRFTIGSPLFYCGTLIDIVPRKGLSFTFAAVGDGTDVCPLVPAPTKQVSWAVTRSSGIPICTKTSGKRASPDWQARMVDARRS